VVTNQGNEGMMPDTFTRALNAVGELLEAGFAKISLADGPEGLCAHSEIEQMPIAQKTGPFYRHFFPLRKELVVLLADSYRRYFRLALAHPHKAANDPDRWAQAQLGPAVRVVLEWIRDWYILACDGENRWVRRVGSMPFVPGQTGSISIPLPVPPIQTTSWRAPAWLFAVSPLLGIEPLKPQHVPDTDSKERLGKAHTRLLLKGARRAFLWELGAAIETVRNEEVAAAGAVRAEISNGQRRSPNKRKGWEQRGKLHGAIRKILSANPGLQGMEFCAELDKRHAPPLLDWKESGEWRNGLTWKEAWRDSDLRRKIRRVRQEAQKAH
jgi:hypothetical protein